MQVTIKVNGKTQATSQTSGSYVAVNRKWNSGDVVEVELPMTLRTEPLPGNAGTVAFVYGPIVLAGKLGTKGISPGSDIVINERTIGDVLNDPMDVPVLAGDAENILQKIQPVASSSLTFMAPVPGRANGITLISYFRIAHER